MILIYIVCKNKEEAKKIGLNLLKKKLIACYNLWPIESAYHWRKKLVKDKEAVLLLKTKSDKYNRIERAVKEIHSYKVPAIFSIKTQKTEKKYLNWLENSIK